MTAVALFLRNCELKESNVDPFVIIIDNTAEWHHSTFPEPLITLDYDAEGHVIKIVALGSAARKLVDAVSKVSGVFIQ